jgi:hypothetical protein
MMVWFAVSGIDKMPREEPLVIVVTQIFSVFWRNNDHPPHPTVSQLLRQLDSATYARFVAIRDDGNASSGPKKRLQILETTDTVWSAHCRQTHI